MTKPMNFYWEEHKRTLAGMRRCALKQQYSCQHPPLLNIPLEHVVLDELHLMLRQDMCKLHFMLTIQLRMSLIYSISHPYYCNM